MDVHPTKNVSIGIDPYPYMDRTWWNNLPFARRTCVFLPNIINEILESPRSLKYGSVSIPMHWLCYVPQFACLKFASCKMPRSPGYCVGNPGVETSIVASMMMMMPRSSERKTWGDWCQPKWRNAHPKSQPHGLPKRCFWPHHRLSSRIKPRLKEDKFSLQHSSFHRSWFVG